MGLARNLEKGLEGFMEGFFTRLFRSKLQPLEVGRRLQREMGENKTISVNRVYAPNDFRIFIGPEDYERFLPLQAGLLNEFSDVIIETAKQNRWNLTGRPQVVFIEEDDFGRGEFRVESSLTADEGDRAPAVATRQPDETDIGATRAISMSTAERLGVSGSGAVLVVQEGAGRTGETIAITRSPVVIGRLSSVDIVLADANVSRRHAELRREGVSWKLKDLGSTNGTFVNNKPVTEGDLQDGDRLLFGNSELVFNTVPPGNQPGTGRSDPNATQAEGI
ncbi:MAG: DUF3662 and FHA domain-containing protein [Actinobacteria bacterium]|nr:DUF3662 and FHA domain-containing protein [Actinomycetota bacterium]MDQ3531600.1 DUF3662 and FHA domain-containing protein [Actinomycetota bacterium]